jgi:hypothetical protein
MADSTLNRFLASGTAAERAAFTPTPPTPSSGPDSGYLFYETDTDDLYAWDSVGAAWVAISSSGISDGATLATGLTFPNTGLHILDTNASHDLILAPGSNITADRTLTITTGDANRTLTLPIVSVIGITIDGGGSAITTGVKGYVECPYAGTITAATLVADQSGSIVIDVWKDTYANFPPVDADSITASAPPTLSSAQKSQDTTLTGWTTSVAAGDILGFNVDSITTVTRVTLTLKLERS